MCGNVIVYTGCTFHSESSVRCIIVNITDVDDVLCMATDRNDTSDRRMKYETGSGNYGSVTA